SVATVADLAGLKLRVVPSQSLKLFFEKAGSQVVVLPFTEVFTALQQGTVDGQENGVILTHQARFFEAQKYVTLSNHSYVMSTITASTRALDRLSEEDQALLAEIGDEVGKWQVKRNRDNVASALEELRAAGVEILELTPAAVQGFRDLAEEVWNELTPVYGQERVDALRALIASSEGLGRAMSPVGPSWFRGLRRAEAAIVTGEKAVCALAMAVMMFSTGLTVLARNAAIQMPNYGELGLAALVPLTLIGGALCTAVG